MSCTLMLNADGQPLSLIPLSRLNWQESIKLLWEETATPVIYYEDWVVRSPSVTLQVPSVMMLQNYVNVNRGVKFSRANIYLRDEFTCQYCGVNFNDRPHELTLDHVVPRYRGGGTTWTNISTACMKCNVEKSHHDHMKPRVKPFRPDYYMLVNRRQKFPIVIPDERWAEFLKWDKDSIIVQPERRKNEGAPGMMEF